MALWNRTARVLDPVLGVPVTTRAREVERRDPTAATRPVVYQSPGQPQIPLWDAMNAVRFGYLANVFVYRCVQVRGNALAGLPIRVGADPERPKDFDRKNSTTLAKLLSAPPYGPNPETTGARLLAWSLAQYDVTGRWAWELELDSRDAPTYLWPLPSPYLKAVPSESGARYFSRFEYGRSGEERRLSADQVFYEWRPSMDDWRQPESVLQAARYDVSVAVMQDRYDHAFLKNDARPASVVIYEGFASDDEDTAFRRRFTNDFGGPDNAGRAMFVEADRDGTGGVSGAIEVKALGISQKDMQSVERYKQKLRALTVAFGVPLSRLGDASDRTFANADEETLIFWEGMVPDANTLRDAVNLKLAPRVGSNVMWFDFSKVKALRPPRRFTAVEGIDLVKSRVVTRNEVREELDMPPVEGGDTIEEAAPVVVAPPAPPPLPVPSKNARPHRAREVETRAMTPEEHEQRRTKIWRTADAQAKALERTFMRQVRTLFARQERETVRRLEGKRGRQQTRDVVPGAEGLFDVRYWRTATAEQMEAVYEAIFAVGGARIAERYGISFDVSAPYVAEFVRGRANQLAGFVTDTTYDAVAETMAEGAMAGETIPQIAARIRAVFADADLNRSVTIARTETISAFNGSAVTVAAQLPADVAAGQEWIATRDNRTREDHAGADGQVVNVGDSFDVGGEPLAYPGDPNASPANVVNCRCTVGFLTPDEMAERGVTPREKRVPAAVAVAVIRMVRPGVFDPDEIRSALLEAA